MFLHKLSFRNLTELRTEQTKPSVIAISEVKPKNFKREIQLSEFNIEGYEILSVNLSKNSPGRGMLLYVKESLKYSPVIFNDINFEENILCEINIGHNKKILVGSVYRSPSSSYDNFKQLCKLFVCSVNKHFSEVFLFGDMNFPNIDWIFETVFCINM